MKDELLDLLYRSFDSDLTAEEQSRLEEGLAASAELRAEKQRLESMRSAITSGAAESFRPFFAERVMQRLEGELKPENGIQELFDSLAHTFRRIAVVGAAAAVVLIALNLSSSEDKTLAAAFGVNESSVEYLIGSPLESVLE
jgi:anti-sigma factor RsiW